MFAIDPSILFIQNRTHRAGAQTSLARLMRHQTMQRWNPVVLCSPGGWLVSNCRAHGIPVIEARFPSSRSLAGRLFGNAAFARAVARQLESRRLRPDIVHANDHTEGLLGFALARRLGARGAITLRSAAMRQDDYFKYACDRYDFIAAVGEQFRDRVQQWEPRRQIAQLDDGLFADEIEPAKPVAPAPPRRVLAIGSPDALKGWADLTEALFILEREGNVDGLEIDFTGTEPESSRNDLQLGRLGKVRCRFLGRVDAFRDLVRGYDLVINPSRMETFGMAAVEVVAAGVPLLSSTTGVIEQVLEPPDVLFPPHRPDLLAAGLNHVLRHWPQIDFGIVRGQENIRARFLIDRTAAKLSEAYEGLLATPKGQL